MLLYLDGVLRVDRRVDGRVGGSTLSMGPLVGDKTGTGRAGEGPASLVVDVGWIVQDEGCKKDSAMVSASTSGIVVVAVVVVGSNSTVFSVDFDDSRISTVSFVPT